MSLTPTTPKERAQIELSDLEQKIDLLEAFIQTNPKYFQLTQDARHRIATQFEAMRVYRTVLGFRIQLDF